MRLRLALCVFLLAGCATAARAPVRSGPAPALPAPLAGQARPPRLVVLLVVDQMTGDALRRWRPDFRAGGIQELLKDGMTFQEAYWRPSAPGTAGGQALLASGQYASATGLVGDAWYDVASRRVVDAASDDSVQASTPSARPLSPHLFEGLSLAQRVKRRYPQARVVGVSLRGRDAVLLAGPGADASYWFDPDARRFVTSSYYHDSPAPLLFNYRLPEFLKERSVWGWSIPKPRSAVCPGDRAAYHGAPYGLGRAFPHRVRNLDALADSPYGNELLELFSEQVIKAYDLGRNPSDQPDVLAISFSAYDEIGRAYGPDSCETADAIARLDTTLNRFLQRLVANAPPDRLLVAFASDHSAESVPQWARARGEDAGRLDLSDPVRPALPRLPRLRRRIEEIGAGMFSSPLKEKGPFFIASFQEPCLYLDPDGPAKGREAAVRSWLKDFMVAQPGILAAATREELLSGKADPALQRSFDPGRSGDVCMLLKPGWIWSSSARGAGPGSARAQERAPLILWGDSIPAGDQFEIVTMDQLAPTLAQLMGLPLDGFANPSPLPNLAPLPFTP